MTKERVILAFVAIIAGLVLASSIFYFYQQKGPSQLVRTPTPTVVSTSEKMLLEVESPEEDFITNAKTITIQGKSQPGALIIITTNTDDFALNADTDGIFTKEVALTADENLITVTAYTESGASETKEIAVTVTEEEF